MYERSKKRLIAFLVLLQIEPDKQRGTSNEVQEILFQVALSRIVA